MVPLTRTTDSAVDEILDGLAAFSPREQRALFELAETVENGGRRRDFSKPEVQAWLANQVGRRQSVLDYERAAAGLFEDLAQLGLNVIKVSDLEVLSNVPSGTVQVLLKWLDDEESRTLRMHIASALGSSWADTQALEGLRRFLEALSDRDDPYPNQLRSTIVASLMKHAARVGSAEFIKIALNPVNGAARGQAITALSAFRKQKADLAPQLLTLLASDDGDLYLPAATVLGQWNVIEARAQIQHLIDTVDERSGRTPASQKIRKSYELDELRKALWRITPT